MSTKNYVIQTTYIKHAIGLYKILFFQEEIERFMGLCGVGVMEVEEFGEVRLKGVKFSQDRG